MNASKVRQFADQHACKKPFAGGAGATSQDRGRPSSNQRGIYMGKIKDRMMDFDIPWIDPSLLQTEHTALYHAEYDLENLQAIQDLIASVGQHSEPQSTISHQAENKYEMTAGDKRPLVARMLADLNQEGGHYDKVSQSLTRVLANRHHHHELRNNVGGVVSGARVVVRWSRLIAIIITVTILLNNLTGSIPMVDVKDKITSVDISKIDASPFQGRFLSSKEEENDEKTKKGLDELCASITAHGIVQPPILRKVGDRYEVVDGGRRLYAAQILHIRKVPAIVREYDDRQAQAFSVIGNIQRVNLRPMELSRAYHKAITCGLYKSNKELAKAVGKSEAHVGEILNALRLDSRVIADLDKNATIADVRVLRAIRSCGEVDDNHKSDSQYALYDKIVTEKMSRDQILGYVRDHVGKKHPDGTRLLTFSKSGRASMSFNASALDPNKRPALETAILAVIDTFLATDDSVKEVPTAA